MPSRRFLKNTSRNAVVSWTSFSDYMSSFRRFVLTVADVVEPFALVFEIARTGEGVFAAGKQLGEGRERIGLPLIAYGFVVNDRAFDLRVIVIFDLFTGPDIAHGKPER